MKPLLILIISLIVTVQGFSQDKQKAQRIKPITKGTFGINLYGGGPSIITSASLSYYLTSNLNLETGIGWYSPYLGAKYHFYSKKNYKRLAPYAGLFWSRIPKFAIDFSGRQLSWLYAPVGIEYRMKKFTIALEGAVIFMPMWFGTLPWAGLRLGYRFGDNLL